MKVNLLLGVYLGSKLRIVDGLLSMRGFVPGFMHCYFIISLINALKPRSSEMQADPKSPQKESDSNDRK